MDVIKTSAFCSLTRKQELECLTIQHPKFAAEFCLQGAQLTQFQAVNKRPLIWLSPTAEYKGGSSVRGGIPVCWPWFGALHKNPESVRRTLGSSDQAHGFARTALWTIKELQESCHEISVTFELTHNEDTLKIWPQPFRLTLVATLSNHIELSLICENLSDETWNISQALHTYFPVDSIHDCRIVGAHRQTYIDALDEWKEKQQQGNIKIGEEVDRLYFGKSDYRIATSEQTIRVQSNSNSSVIWNPWIEKSTRLSQFPNQAYKNMLCIESANVMHDCITLAPAESHTLQVTIQGDT